MKPGSYRVQARAVVQTRAGPPEVALDGCALALLTRQPAPEGGSLEELEAPEYVRQPVRFARASESGEGGRTLRSLNGVSFTPVTAWPTPTHVAIVDAEGQVLGYGYLATSAGHARHDELAFAPSAVELKFK